MCDSCGWQGYIQAILKFCKDKHYLKYFQKLIEIQNDVRNKRCISEREIKTIVNIKDEVESQTKKNPKNLEAVILNNIQIDNYITVPNEKTYEWTDTGYFKVLEDAYIKFFLKDYSPNKRISEINELYNLFKLNTLIPKEETMNKNRHLINCKNGMIDLNSKESNLLKIHDKKYLSSIQLDLDFDYKALCPKFENFLKEVVPDDNDKKILQEFAGYCLTTEIKYQKALILLGEGANGKSTFQDVLEEIIGEPNITHISLSNFSQDFAKILLLNKLANFSSEIELGEVVDSENFKKIVVGNKITASHKGKDIIEFKPFCKLIFATNKLPRLRDNTHGFSRRLIIIKFPVIIEEKHQNKNLTKELIEEKSGILNWALEGLQRLEIQGGFTESESAKDALEEYKLQNNHILEFINDELFVVPRNEIAGVKLSRTEVYEKYIEFCKNSNYKFFGRKSFVSELNNILKNKIEYKQTTYNGFRDMCFFGMQFKN